MFGRSVDSIRIASVASGVPAALASTDRRSTPRPARIGVGDRKKKQQKKKKKKKAKADSGSSDDSDSSFTPIGIRDDDDDDNVTRRVTRVVRPVGNPVTVEPYELTDEQRSVLFAIPGEDNGILEVIEVPHKNDEELTARQAFERAAAERAIVFQDATGLPAVFDPYPVCTVYTNVPGHYHTGATKPFVSAAKRATLSLPENSSKEQPMQPYIPSPYVDERTKNVNARGKTVVETPDEFAQRVNEWAKRAVSKYGPNDNASYDAGVKAEIEALLGTGAEKIVDKNMYVKKISDAKGYGVFAKKQLARGTVLCLYVGEMVGKESDAARREQGMFCRGKEITRKLDDGTGRRLSIKNDEEHSWPCSWYLLDANREEAEDEKDKMSIDPLAVGNIGRFFNDPRGSGKEANCIAPSYHRVGDNKWLPQVLLYVITTKKVEAGTELCWEYGPSYWDREFRRTKSRRATTRDDLICTQAIGDGAWISDALEDQNTSAWTRAIHNIRFVEGAYTQTAQALAMQGEQSIESYSPETIKRLTKLMKSTRKHKGDVTNLDDYVIAAKLRPIIAAKLSSIVDGVPDRVHKTYALLAGLYFWAAYELVCAAIALDVYGAEHQYELDTLLRAEWCDERYCGDDPFGDWRKNDDDDDDDDDVDDAGAPGATVSSVVDADPVGVRLNKLIRLRQGSAQS